MYDIRSFRLPADAEVVGDMGTPDASLRSASGVMEIRLPAEACLRVMMSYGLKDAKGHMWSLFRAAGQPLLSADPQKRLMPELVYGISVVLGAKILRDGGDLLRKSNFRLNNS